MECFWQDALEFTPILLQGAVATILVTAGSLIFSSCLGLVWALMRISGSLWLDRVAVTAIQAAILGLGIAAIDHGQIEATQSIGMGRFMTLCRVVLPQAFRISLPPYGNTMIMLLKDSSQASTITVAELALQGKLIAASSFKNATVFTLAALLGI